MTLHSWWWGLALFLSFQSTNSNSINSGFKLHNLQVCLAARPIDDRCFQWPGFFVHIKFKDTGMTANKSCRSRLSDILNILTTTAMP